MAKLRTYGNIGNEESEDQSRCIIEVWDREISCLRYQCQRKRGHGPKGEYCKQHAKQSEQSP